jgi:nucleotide-binding universal stress UspA family protein
MPGVSLTIPAQIVQLADPEAGHAGWRFPASAGSGNLETAEGGSMSWKTIVVGYDRTHASNKALLRAADLAEFFGSALVVTSVARVLPSGAAAHGVGPFDPADDPALHAEDLRHAQELIATRKLKVEPVYDLEAGDPADAIVALARRRSADLIVVGGHERGFLGKLLHGGIDEHVTREAPCDVLVVH